MNLSFIALVVFLLIAVRQVGNVRIPIWQAMLLGAFIVVLGGRVTSSFIQNAERRAKQTLTFWEFTRVGLPLPVVNVLVYRAWLRFV